MTNFSDDQLEIIAKAFRDCEPEGILEKELWMKIVHTLAHDLTEDKRRRRWFRQRVFGEDCKVSLFKE